MPEDVSGVVKVIKKGGASLRSPSRNFKQSGQDPLVPQAMVDQFGLVDGAFVEATAENNEVREIVSVSGLSPLEFSKRRPYQELVAVDPCERFDLSVSDDLSMRIMDMVSPIGKGTRGLIVSPPKAGKTVLLEKIAATIRQVSPDTRIIALLIDERPEEVTHFRRTVDAEVLASSSDQGVDEHIELAELTLAHIQTELECGKDVVILIDSLTRMGRAFNLRGSGKGKGKIMSGGVEAGALESPRRFFGLARNIEGGGSVTIIATALIDTGSRMDQLIFEEFKGTGNSELILDRGMAESMVWPAIDLAQSGTRKEYKLFGENTIKRLFKLRRVLSERKPKEAMLSLLKLMEKYGSNEEFLKSIPV